MIKNNIENSEHFFPSIEKLNEINSKIHEMGGYSAHNHQHILYVIKELLGDKCKNYLEIGVACGSSMASVFQSKYSMRKFYGIDLFEESTGSRNKEKVIEILNSLNPHNHEFKLIQGDSHDKKTISELSSDLEVEGIDFFYIDGNHSAKYVESDFNDYEHLVNSGGVIVFDDAVNVVLKSIQSMCNDEKIRKNYINVGLIDSSIYSNEKLDKLQTSKYKYNSNEDDITKHRKNWQYILVKK